MIIAMSLEIERKNKSEGSFTACDQYRAAFERLKNDCPIRLPKGSSVSQNNVAKEAGTDPSALKKTRFPILIAEIQKYVAEHAQDRPISTRQVILHSRKKNRDLRSRIQTLVLQRDKLASLLSEADTIILELHDRIKELESQLPASNVLPLDARGSRRL